MIDIVINNWNMFREAGLLEEAFIDAWSAQKGGVPNWSPGFCQFVFSEMDPEKLLNTGDPLPEGDSFSVYRGVAGVGRQRRVHGYSWTGDIETAKLFAGIRVSRYGLPSPAVFRATIQRKHVLAYINESGRNEQEFLVCPECLTKIKKVA